MKQIVNNGDKGLVARTKINSNFSELYGALNFPLQLEGITGNATQVIPTNCLMIAILVRPDAGSPVLALGTSPGQGNVLGSQEITDEIPISALIPFLTGGTIYATLSGGTVSIAFITINNVF